MKKNEGITLIALTVTIMILLILAGITISVVFSDDGIIKKAKESANMQNEATKNMQNEISDLTDELKETLGERKIEEVIGKPARDRNQILRDNYGNYMTLPAGFTVVPNGISNVEYTYTGDGIPAVQDGIVIQDSDGNQFVWIPIGTIYNKEGDANGIKTDIILGRYIFDATYDSTQDAVLGTGKATLVQNADNYTEVVDITEYCHRELITSNEGNATAKDLGKFIQKTKTNHGYYIARYEASYRDGGIKPYSIQSEGTPAMEKPSSYTNKQLWNFIDEPEASKVCQSMYSSNQFESDLTNSYAWDTAIVFIQNYSGDTDYSKENAQTFNTNLSNTGVNGDKVCNVYDMASNISEWTTETTLLGSMAPDVYTNHACTNRGGRFANKNFASIRVASGFDGRSNQHGFRPIIYLL